MNARAMLGRIARALLIVNPVASRVTDAAAEAVARALGEVEVVWTEYSGHGTELARAASGTPAVYVFSGDGGFNEALNGIDRETPLGFLPGGGTSVLPRALGLPRDPLRAAERLVRAKPRRISVGGVNGRRFGFSAGLGFDAELVRRVDARGRTAAGVRAGDAAFATEAFRLLRARAYRLEPVAEVEGAGRAAFVLVANCDPYTYVGPLALHVAPDARFELGVDLVAPRRVTPRSLPRLIAYALRGRGQQSAHDVIYLHDVGGVRVTCDAPLPLHVDGEDVGDVTEAVFGAEREAVTVLV